MAPRWKLTKETAEEIRQAIDAGVPSAKICAHYNVTKSTLSRIRTGKIWPREDAESE